MEMMVVECVPPALETVHTVKFMLSVCYHSEEMGGKPEVELSGGSYASTGFVRGSAPPPIPLTRLQHSLRNSHRQPLANPSQPLGSMDWTWAAGGEPETKPLELSPGDWAPAGYPDRDPGGTQTANQYYQAIWEEST